MSPTAHNRVEVLHGVNLDMLGRRDPEHYGTLTLAELETQVKRFGRELDLEVAFFQTNHEGEFVERLHRLPELADAAILNPGAWTHYSWAIRDALEIAGLPAVEVHLSDVATRERVAPPLGARGPGASARLRQGRRRLSRGARAAEAGAGAMSPVRPSAPSACAELVAEQDLEQLIVGDLVRPGDSGPDAIANLALADRLHRDQRRSRSSAPRPGLHHRLPLRRARRTRGRAAFERVSAERGCCPTLAGRLARPGRLRRRADQRRQPATSSSRRSRRPARAPSWSPPAASSSGCAGKRTPPSRRRSRRRHGSPTRSTSPCSPAGSPGAPSARSPAAAAARIRELGAEPSFPAIVARGGERRPAARRAVRRARSAPASWSCGTWARCSTAIARTAPAPSPPASPARTRARSTSSCAQRRRPGSRRSGRGSAARTPTRPRAS